MLTRAIREAREAVYAAWDALDRQVQVDCPKGSYVRWKWADRVYAGTVIRHGSRGRLFVRNAATGKERWISAWNLL